MIGVNRYRPGEGGCRYVHTAGFYYLLHRLGGCRRQKVHALGVIDVNKYSTYNAVFGVIEVDTDLIAVNKYMSTSTYDTYLGGHRCDLVYILQGYISSGTYFTDLGGCRRQHDIVLLY